MSLQVASVIEPYVDIGSCGDSVSAEAPALVNRDVSVSVAAHGERRFQQSGGPFLTERECRIVTEISRGASNKQVARLLDISPSTVRTHVERIFRKLECSTRAAATLKAAKLGLIS